MEPDAASGSCRRGRHYRSIPLYANVTEDEWSDWRWQIKHSITTLADLSRVLNLTALEREGLLAAREHFRMAVTPYLAALMDPDDPYCPVRMQFVPTKDEMRLGGEEDPLAEEKYRVAPGLIHRYPDRVLLLVNNMCASYCRFCTRKRYTSQDNEVLPRDEFEQALAYLRDHPGVRDVLVSGGDPLTMSDSNLDYVLGKLREIPSVEIVRIGTRVPMFLPQRVTPALVEVLAKHHPVWMNTHFNHPKELTPEAVEACRRIVSAGIPLGNQSVLLRGVNSDLYVMRELVHALVRARVRPYYLYQCDVVEGTEHFRTSVGTGLAVMESLRGYTSGFAVPTFVIDAPGGGGKIPVAPTYVTGLSSTVVEMRNYEGRPYTYPQPHEPTPSQCPYTPKWMETHE